MPDEVMAGAGHDDRRERPRLTLTGPIGRAAPTRVVPLGGVARSRRWLIAGAIVVAALLAGASAALASAGSSPAHPAHAAARSAQPKEPHTVAAPAARPAI